MFFYPGPGVDQAKNATNVCTISFPEDKSKKAEKT